MHADALLLDAKKGALTTGAETIQYEHWVSTMLVDPCDRKVFCGARYVLSSPAHSPLFRSLLQDRSLHTSLYLLS